MTGITLSEIAFNDGTNIELSPQDIVVFVGSNNTGKSQSLRDIFNSLSFDHGNKVVTRVDFLYHNPEGIEEIVKEQSLTTPIGNYYAYSGYQYEIQSISLPNFWKKKLVDENIKRFLVSMVKTEERLTTSSPKEMVDIGEKRKYPLHYIIDSNNRQTVSDIFEKIFNQKIFCEDRGSKMLTLHMGSEIDFNKEGMTAQQVSDEFYKRMGDLPKIHEQGDGIRSLVGLLLNLMMPNYTMFLIDEPEAFLHPPQARILGESIPGLLGEKQAFISTHSIDLIKGLLTSAEQRVKIIRLRRDGNSNPVYQLQSPDLNAIWKDPIMRHSNILDGLFYHHTILCESDSDCQLYAAMYSYLKGIQNSYSDALFTLCNGKGRMKPLSRTFKSLGIDYRIVPDLDFFNDKGLVKAVFENCGGKWDSIKDDYQVLYEAMNMPDGTLPFDSFINKVREMVEERGWNEMTKPSIKKLGVELPKLLENQWDKLKHNGLDVIKEPKVREAADRLIIAMNSVGIYPVTEGELESFFPDVGNHGPGYAVAVLDNYSDLSDPVYDKLRDFVSSWGI